jgi:hypothetical protein
MYMEDLGRNLLFIYLSISMKNYLSFCLRNYLRGSLEFYKRYRQNFK